MGQRIVNMVTFNNNNIINIDYFNSNLFSQIINILTLINKIF